MSWPSPIVDGRARDLAALVLAGDLDPVDGLWELTALVHRSVVPRQVAVRLAVSGAVRPNGVDQLAQELTDRLAGLVQPGPEGRPACRLDLSLLAAGGSFSAWLRSIGDRVGRTTVYRNRGREAARLVPCADDVLASLPGVTRHPVREVLRREEALDRYRVFAARAVDHGEQLHARADAVRDVYGLPLVTRPRTAEQRAAVLAALDDPEHVRRLLAALSQRRQQPDSPVLGVFADYTVSTLAATPVEAVVLLARSAVTARRAPRRARVRELEQWAVAAMPAPPGRQLPPRPRQYRVRGLVRAWLAATFDRDEASEGPTHKEDAQIAADVAAFTAAANGCLDDGISHLGRTVDEIGDTLAAALLAIERESADSVAARIAS